MDKTDFESWLERDESLYRRCTDPACPRVFAYTAPFPETAHYHYVGPKTTIDWLRETEPDRWEITDRD